MVEQEKKLTFYSDLLDDLNNKEEENCSDSVELFFSFDIVNSSLYKTINLYGWQNVLTAILEDVKRTITKELPGSQLWRVLGDEIIFFLTIRDKEEIYEVIEKINIVLLYINDIISNGKLLNGAEERNNSFETKDYQNVLGVQATAWLAIVSIGKKKELDIHNNILWQYSLDGSNTVKDFLGQDIDIGFRLKKETENRRFIISVELAAILCECTKYVENLNIIAYKKLKGVWSGRLYPIIWYHDKEESKVSFDDSFFYDELEQSTLSKEYFENRRNPNSLIQKELYLDVPKAIRKVISDQRLTKKINNIFEIIKSTERDRKNVENEFEHKFLEFHCAAVCCNVDTKKILIVKRKDRKIYSDIWEFGCARASTDTSLEESIKKDYENDLGIKIDIVKSLNRENEEPVPLALYEIEKTDKLQKGVIVVAKIINSDHLDEKVKMSDKHSEYKWIGQDDVDGFNEKSVSDLNQTMEEVFNRWSDFFKEGE